MVQFPQTVDTTVELAQGASPGPAVGRLALVAPTGGLGTVAVNVIKTYGGSGAAVDDRGAGSKLAVGVQHVLGEGHPNVVTIAPEEFTVNYTFGDSVEGATTDGQVPAASVPLTSVTSATKDGVAIPAADIVYLTDDQDPDTYVFTGTQKMAINMKTGEIELATATTGSGAGLVLVAKRHDWSTAFELLGEEDYEYAVPAGYDYSPANWGVWSAFLTHADGDNKMLAGMLPSGADPAVYEAFVEATRNGRLSLLAAKSYTGDGTSAYAAYRAKYATHAQIKRQPAPRSITISQGYVFSEYGGHQSPSAGTWHAMGVNAVYKYRGGWLISASRASTGLTAIDRWDYIMRIVREVDESLQSAVGNQLSADPTGNPVSQIGLDKTESNMDVVLRGFVAEGKLTEYSVKMPLLSSLTQAQKDNGEVGDAEVLIKPTRQIGFISIRIRVQ